MLEGKEVNGNAVMQFSMSAVRYYVFLFTLQGIICLTQKLRDAWSICSCGRRWCLTYFTLLLYRHYKRICIKRTRKVLCLQVCVMIQLSLYTPCNWMLNATNHDRITLWVRNIMRDKFNLLLTLICYSIYESFYPEYTFKDLF